LQRPLDDLDGAHDTGAEATRLGEYYFHRQYLFRLSAAAMRHEHAA
jgi:hypothetical protein